MFFVVSYVLLLGFFVFVVLKTLGIDIKITRKLWEYKNKDKIISFENKVVVITGASSGIGKELALFYAKKKARLGLAARRKDAIEELKKECLRLGSPTVVCCECDVAKELDCKNFISSCTSQFGDKIDYLFLSAGVGLDERFDDANNLDAYRSIMDINYFGAISCTYYALPHLKKAHGHICAISSLQGKFSLPERCGYCKYFLLSDIFAAGSKHAVNGFFHSLRIEMKGQVNVTVVCPGYVWTAFQDSKLSAGKDSSEGSRDKNKFMTAEQCVKEIHDAIKYNEAEYIMTLKGKAGVVAQALLPRAIIDKMATSTKNAAHQKH